MKDYTKEQFEKNRPVVESKKAIDYCLNALYNDKEHVSLDEPIKGLTFSQLMGALIKARNIIEDLTKPDKSNIIEPVVTDKETLDAEKKELEKQRINKITQDFIRREAEKNKIKQIENME